jgi:hypothetical protein
MYDPKARTTGWDIGNTALQLQGPDPWWAQIYAGTAGICRNLLSRAGVLIGLWRPSRSAAVDPHGVDQDQRAALFPHHSVVFRPVVMATAGRRESLTQQKT